MPATKVVQVVVVGNVRQAQQALAELSGSAAAAESGLAALGKRLQAQGAVITRTGQAMTRWLTLPIALVSGAAIKMSMDFEQSMTKIQGLVGVSRQQVAAWSDEVLNLAKGLPQSPKELADALFFVTSAGLRGQQAMDALTASARAAAAGLGETKTVADAVTSAMIAYSGSGLTAAQATDTLIATVREGKMPVEDLAGSIGGVLSAASLAGVSLQEVGGIIASLTRVSVPTARAVTGLRFVLQALQRPSNEAQDVLAGVGLSVADVQRSIRERGLFQTLQMLAKRFDVTSASGMAAFQTLVGGSRGWLVVAPMVGDAAKTVGQTIDKVRASAGVTDKAFEAMSQTVGFRLRAAWTSVQVALIRFGDAIAPAVVAVAAAVTGLADAFMKLPVPMQRVLGFGLLLVAALGPLVTIIGRVNSLVGGFLRILPGVVNWFQRFAQGFMDARVAASAFSGTAGRLGGMLRGALVPGLGLVAGALTVGIGVWMAWRQAQEEARQRVEQLTQALREDAGAIGQHTRALVVDRLESEGLLEAAQRLGISFELVTAAALGDKDAQQELARVLGEVRAAHTEVEHAGRSVVVQMDSQAEEAHRLAVGLARLTGDLADARGSTERVTAAMNAAKQATQGLGRATVRFAGMAGKTLDDFKESVTSNFRSALTSVSGFRKGWELTAAKFSRTVPAMARKAQQVAEDMASLDKQGVPEKFKAWLLQQGPDAVHAFAAANREQKNRIVAAWRDMNEAASSVGDHISGLGEKLRRPFELAGGAVSGLRDRLMQLNGITVSAFVNVVQRGARVRGMAEGGIVTRPTLALIGERGPEAVVPLRGRQVPVPSRLDVRLHVDRRRFTDQVDVAYSFGGGW
jgi:TP901 family phage tail tape measure protein